MEPGTEQFIEKYPFQIQVFKPYRKWVELTGHNFATANEALTVMKYLEEKRGMRRLRVVDLRSGVVAAAVRRGKYERQTKEA